jgi:hypothetical protein
MANRSPMQVDEDFRVRIKKLQETIMRKRGKFESIPKITKQIIHYPEWDTLEKKLTGELCSLEFKINLDRRMQ